MPVRLLWTVVMVLALPTFLAAQELPFGISLPPALNFSTSPSPVGSGARAVGNGTAFIGVADDAPAVAVQLTPTFSVGAAFNIWPNLFGNGWDQDVTVRGEGRVVSGNRIVPFISRGRIQEEFRFRGFNVTAGFLWTINSIFSLGGV